MTAKAHEAIPVEAYESYCSLEHQLGVLFRRSRAISASVGRAVHPELEPGAYSLLVRIEHAAPARPSDLATYFRVGRATISRQVKVLEELGLVGRRDDPLDGRACRLALTEEGEQRLSRARRARQERFYALLTAWSEGDVRLLADMLERFNALTATEESDHLPGTAMPPGLPGA